MAVPGAEARNRAAEVAEVTEARSRAFQIERESEIGL